MDKTYKNDSIFFTDEQNPASYSLRNQMYENLEFRLVKDKITYTPEDSYRAMALSVRDRLIRNWLRTQHQYYKKDVKKVYYLSMEFLMGRLLGNALTNLGINDESMSILRDMSLNLEELKELEHDMGLGNGGLGRLAACFLDSMATQELPAFGYGIRYEYGIFEQEIINGWQVEKPDNWLGYGSPWEIIRPEYTYKVKFNGNVISHSNQWGKTNYEWVDTDEVLALAYDIPIPGYNNNTCNNLRLWEAKASQDFNFDYFNQGDYIKAVENRFETENISKVLYPNDNTVAGKELRLKQQYFFVSASLQDIIRRFKIKNQNLTNFADKNTIQLNDTHPAIAIVELMRILIDIEKLEWETAWDITTKTFAYTNHTVLTEALERWSVNLFEKLLPRHLQIIYDINARFLEVVRMKFYNDNEKVIRMSLIEEGNEKMIRMAHLAIVGSFSVNGVAELHTRILKDKVFNDFYQLYPEKFNNKTNGITQRRWLKNANPSLSNLINNVIGDKWVVDLYELKKLEQFANDSQFQEKWEQSKRENKYKLFRYIENHYNIKVNYDSLVDVQIKRFHEYKRQILNAIELIHTYIQLKQNPKAEFLSRTVIFAGKAAPGYLMAKRTIKLINSIANIINNDPEIGDKLKVVFLKNYSVSLAELIIPATELSEQISTAGFEASGTGNMKFMLNGALTLGTLDGANIEMLEEVGSDNIFIFGMNADEIANTLRNNYQPSYIYETNKDLKAVLDLIKSNFFNSLEPGIFDMIFNDLVNNDRYCVLADFQSYSEMHQKIATEYLDKRNWLKKSILNTARAGKFSSDRTINQYASDIWKIQSTKVVI